MNVKSKSTTGPNQIKTKIETNVKVQLLVQVQVKV
jgi:hypothetical protein